MKIKEIISLINQNEELEPETLKQLYPELTSVDRQRILALRLVMHTHAPFEDFFIFENVVLAINGIEPTIDAVEGCRPEHIWYALDTFERMRKTLPWISNEVIAYIDFIHKDHGLKFSFPRLETDREYLNKVVDRAENGPFPLKEEELDIQASHYLRIKEYINSKSK